MHTLLIANRGEIARRIIRTASGMGIRTVAVYVDADRRAPYVAEADEAHHLISDDHLDIDGVITVALSSGADAVHPGYGFLSENAAFARAVIDAGLQWVGPAPETIDAMGDKIAAKALAERAGVPTLPSVEDPRDLAEVGFPLLVKAAAGGGGKGMRIVQDQDGLSEALSAARREAASAFGDDRIFLERYVERSRHVEIQILGDTHGDLVHLAERECSIQRRHQKIVEESPSPVISSDRRRDMGDAALRLARKLGYHSAGTVEFLYDDDSGDFFFLEVNTRLQVEHPVTESVTGIDLVREQLRIATGAPLGFTQDQLRFRGHAIEVRLYAEDPAAGFLPATGTLAVWRPATSPEVRLDSGVEAGSVVGVEFDPMLAKVVAHAATRHEAALRLALWLERTAISGVVTNRDFLVALLRTDEFLAGDTTTDFLDRVDVAPVAPDVDALAVAAALWLQGANRDAAPVLRTVPSGWRNARTPPESVTLSTGDDRTTISYRARRDGTFDVDGSPARVLDWTVDSIDVEHDGMRLRVDIRRVGDLLHVHHTRGDTTFRVEPRFPEPERDVPAGGLVAPMPGKILDVRVQPGNTVTAGQVVVVMEAMKMEHHLTATTDGTVDSVAVDVGDQVETGAALLVVDSDGS